MNDKTRSTADRALELLEEMNPHQLATEMAELERKHNIAMAALDKMKLQRDQLAAQLSAAKRSWPDKCPITRRDFFMVIDGVPTYGGPYDSYTIPEMLGTPEQPWHDRELFVRRFDHDRGHWVDDEVIDLRVIHDGVLDDLLASQVAGPTVPNGWQLVPVEPPEHLLPKGNSRDATYRRGAIISGWKFCREAMLAAAPKPEGGA